MSFPPSTESQSWHLVDAKGSESLLEVETDTDKLIDLYELLTGAGWKVRVVDTVEADVIKRRIEDEECKQ